MIHSGKISLLITVLRIFSGTGSGDPGNKIRQ
jgi:hypothetical protein